MELGYKVICLLALLVSEVTLEQDDAPTTIFAKVPNNTEAWTVKRWPSDLWHLCKENIILLNYLLHIRKANLSVRLVTDSSYITASSIIFLLKKQQCKQKNNFGTETLFLEIWDQVSK